MSTINAPFSEEQIEALKAWQASRWVHPFTCCDGYKLSPIESGMICPKCGEVQTWVHDFMVEGRTLVKITQTNEKLFGTTETPSRIEQT